MASRLSNYKPISTTSRTCIHDIKGFANRQYLPATDDARIDFEAAVLRVQEADVAYILAKGQESTETIATYAQLQGIYDTMEPCEKKSMVGAYLDYMDLRISGMDDHRAMCKVGLTGYDMACEIDTTGAITVNFFESEY